MSNLNKEFNKNKLLEELRKISKRHEEEYQDLEQICERDLKTLKEKISEQAEEIVDDDDKDKFCEAIKEIEQNMEIQKSNLKLKQAQEHQLIVKELNYNRAGSSSGEKYQQSKNSNKNYHHTKGIYE